VLSPIDVTSIIRSSLQNQPFEFSAVTLNSLGIKAVCVFILLLFIVKDFCEVVGGVRDIERFQALLRPTNGPAGKTR